MAVGTVSKALLTEIANAIREQNGQQVHYMPLEMSSRVLEMDGTREGAGLVAAWLHSYVWLVVIGYVTSVALYHALRPRS